MSEAETLKVVNSLMQCESVAEIAYRHIAVTGADAFDFLQGQLTLDVMSIDETCLLPAGYCSHKGQLYGVLWLYKKDGTLHFLVHESVADRLIKRLSMFVLRSDVTFAHLDTVTSLLSPARMQQLSEALPKKHGQRSGGFARIGHDVHYFLAFDADLPLENVEQAQALKLASGALDVVSSTYEKLLPFQCGLGDLGGISYEKGCYVGQEVIAINKYRGRNDKHITLGILEAPAEWSCTLGEILRDDNGKALGVLADFCTANNLLLLQVIMSERTIASQTVLFGQTIAFNRIF